MKTEKELIDEQYWEIIERNQKLKDDIASYRAREHQLNEIFTMVREFHKEYIIEGTFDIEKMDEITNRIKILNSKSLMNKLKTLFTDENK